MNDIVRITGKSYPEARILDETLDTTLDYLDTEHEYISEKASKATTELPSAQIQMSMYGLMNKLGYGLSTARKVQHHIIENGGVFVKVPGISPADRGSLKGHILCSESGAVKNISDGSAFLHGFWSLIHEDIISTSKKLFENGHYTDSVFRALTVITERVKKFVKVKTGSELDGKKLMCRAFRRTDPIVPLASLSEMTGRDIQEGYMHLYAGAIQGIRNPIAHRNRSMTRDQAISFIFLANLLLDKLPDA